MTMVRILTKGAWHVEGLPPDHYGDDGREDRYIRKRNFAEDLKYFGARRKRHPITAANSRSKERPILRKAIIKYELTPYPTLETWDGFSASDKGQRTFMSTGLRKQMRKMIVEGYFRAH